MDYEQFILAMLECVQSRLPETYSVQRQEVLKNNDVTVVGLSIRQEGERMTPLVYLEDYYEEYCQGETIGFLAEHLLERIKNLPMAPEWEYEDILDFHKVRHQVVYKLINAKKNQRLLKEVPNLPFMDLAIIFYVMISVNEFENCSILIRNAHMDYWKLPISILYQCAKENTPKLCPPVFRTLSEVLQNHHIPSVPDSPLLMLSNENGINGAAAILYSGIPKYISRQIGKNYYILPSSIHELLIAPEDQGIIPANLKEIVREVNENHIDAEDFLSDNIYYFDGNIITEM